MPDLTAQPSPFAVFYGFPGQIRECGNAACVIEALRAFSFTVLGDGLERTRHPEHATTRMIIDGLRDTGSRVYGYIDLGMTTGALRLSEIEQRLAAWALLGAAGVLLDDAGAEYGVSPERLNATVTLAHDQKLRVIVNAGDPVDAFVVNSSLSDGDAYLYEAFAVGAGFYMPVAELLDKCGVARQLAPEGVSLYALATCDNDPKLFDYIWTAAVMIGMDGIGIAPPGYGAIASTAGFLGALRPSLGSFGTRFLAARPRLQGELVVRETDAGLIWVRRQPGARALNAGFIPAIAS